MAAADFPPGVMTKRDIFMNTEHENRTGRLLPKRLPDAWQAKWIDPELPHDEACRQPASVLRRRFAVNKPVREAVLYITCHGLYEAELNGRRVGNFVLAPGTGDYRQRLAVQAYEVTGLLHEGENELRVTLGDGWYRGNVGVDGAYNYYGSDLGLLCQLEADGEILLLSDGRWEASASGPTRLNDLEKGEEYDARLEQTLEQESSWHSVNVRDFGYENLCGEPFVPIVEKERFSGRLITTPNGERVIDFGQNLAGYTELRVTAKAGQKITLWHGETLDEHGNFTQANFAPGERNKNGGIPQRLDYVCKDGLNCWKPRFSIFGFRYAKLETDVDLNRGDAEFTAIAVYSDMRQTGFFTCGNAEVNRLFENSVWSMKGNFCDIPTDCPTRERAGWTGDAGVFAPTGLMLMNCAPVFRKWLGECRLAQRENGLVENIAPVNNTGGMISNMLQGSAGWGDACVLVPWAVYQATGDVQILRENYDMMCRWLSFVGKRARRTRLRNLRNPWRRYLVDQGFHFGEWCEPDVDNMVTMKNSMLKGAPEVATAYYFRSARLAARIAGILGEHADARKFADIAEKAKKAYRFTCTENGSIDSQRQAEYVRPIAFGLLDGEENQAAANALNALVVQNGYHLNTGFLSTPFLCPVLAEYGHVDTAYRLLLQEDAPGWLYAVKHGATTILETWDGIKPDGAPKDSHNHYSYGAVSGWLLSGVCGIRLEEGKLTLRPQPHPSLGWAQGAWEAPSGRIESDWRYAEDGRSLKFDVRVPGPATVELPNGEIHEVNAGNYRYEVRL